MVTFVGMKEDFGADLVDLMELEYDAIEAYEAAINRLDDKSYQNKLLSFKEDHQRHIKEISELLKNHNIEAPTSPSIGKQWITKGKVVLGNLVGDLAVLRAMRSNEIDTNTAYERMYGHEHIWPDAKEVIRDAFTDDKRHKEWLNYVLETE